MDKAEIKKLKKEMNFLGIINIEADGEFSLELVKEAINSVKEANLDFKSLAEQSKQKAVSAK